MAKRTYQRDHGFLMGLAAREAGITTNGCAAFTLARALGAPDEHGEAAQWLPVVVEQLRNLNRCTRGRRGLNESFTNKGGMYTSIAEVGLTVIEMIVPMRWSGPTAGSDTTYPTVAQFLRDHPEIERAVIHTRGHAAFIDERRVYGATARYRVQKAWVLA